MKHNTRLTRIERKRTAVRGRMLMGYSEDGTDGPLWHAGRLVPADSVTASDTVIRICYQAADDAPNVVHLRWGDEDNPMHDDADG